MIRPDDVVVSRYGARFMGRQMPCAIGRGGITRRKREGDGATPAGTHRLVALLYRPDRIARASLPHWAVPIRPGDLWCDDPASKDYNQMVRAPCAASHESLRRADPLYDVILTTNWNWPIAHPGRGSAIFLHRWRTPRFPTAGCVAFSQADLLWIARRLTPESRLIIRP
ncbi:MAG: L,D-transpeptidase family protein [Pararhodobacter sp.]|nr:L,D-transpeptidase family protein [Pararhodobacter sp.]